MTVNGLIWWASAMALIAFVKIAKSIMAQEAFRFATETGQEARCPRCNLLMHFVYAQVTDEGYIPDHVTCPCDSKIYSLELECLGRLN